VAGLDEGDVAGLAGLVRGVVGYPYALAVVAVLVPPVQELGGRAAVAELVEEVPEFPAKLRLKALFVVG